MMRAIKVLRALCAALNAQLPHLLVTGRGAAARRKEASERIKTLLWVLGALAYVWLSLLIAVTISKQSPLQSEDVEVVGLIMAMAGVFLGYRIARFHDALKKERRS